MLGRTKMSSNIRTRESWLSPPGQNRPFWAVEEAVRFESFSDFPSVAMIRQSISLGKALTWSAQKSVGHPLETRPVHWLMASWRDKRYPQKPVAS
jgi:hypothetical protein